MTNAPGSARLRSVTGGTVTFEIHPYGEVDSTNDLAFGLAAEGFGEGTTILADSQRKGRGRRGRTWHSPPGANLYFSFLLAPERDQREWPELSWVIAGAVALGLVSRGVSSLAIKSPNDVLARGRKIAGVLLENRVGAGRAAPVVAGIGLNVNMPSPEVPDDIREGTTSVMEETGKLMERNGLLGDLLRTIGECYRQWAVGGGGELRRRMETQGIAFIGFDE